METKKLELSATVDITLRNIARKTDDLLSDMSYDTLKDYAEKPATILKQTRQSEERFKKLLEQLPEGIYITVKHVLHYVEEARKRNNVGSLGYSPLVLTYSDFKCCKTLRYQKGHIITGRDKEIDQILLTLCKSSKRGVILVGEPGVGKAQPVTEPVLTDVGWISMGAIRIGMNVITQKGTAAKVLGVFPQGIIPVFELEFSDGRTTRCGADHLWKIYSKNWKRIGSESRILELKTIKEIKDNTRERLYIDLPNPRYIPDKGLPIDPYILGVLIGDGSITRSARFTNSSLELIEYVRTRLIDGYSLTVSKQRNTYQVDIVGVDKENHYTKELRNLNLLGKKSYTKFIPDTYKDLNMYQTQMLLAGLLDTDGSVGANGNIQFYSTSEQLAKDVMYLVRSIGGTAKLTKKKTKYGYNGEQKEGRLCHMVSISIQLPKPMFWLARKRARLPSKLKRNLKLEIKNIKEVDSERCVCIYIDDPDHLYITKDFIVTHNTAMVNAINARLIERNVPTQLVGAQILNLDIPYVFTKFKEDPMGTIIKVLERASAYDKAILFIDEVHQLLGHKMNDVMKPYLTEQIRFIGSTTINEYHSIITDDIALERRFTLVHVAEPNITQTAAMIKGTKSVLEDEHKCTIPDDICEYTVVNGSRFLGHRKNPDKSLDLLDIACAIMDEREKKLESTREDAKGEFIPDLELNRKEILSAKVIPGERTLSKMYVDLAISSVTGIEYGKIKNSLEFSEVLGALKDKVFGQDESVKTLANIVNIFKHVKYDRERPIATILVAGPSGVGKKLSAQVLAKSLYGKESSYIEFDMSGMTSEFMITELKGAPPGYVGYGKSGGLIKSIRNNPQSLVYFRGINRADISIIQYVIDASRHGKIVDSAEREASLNNTIMIFSVTLSDEEGDKVFKGKARSIGFSAPKDEKQGEINEDELKKIVGEDLIKSVDEVIVFKPLAKDMLKKIFEANIDRNLEMYDVDIDRSEVEKKVLEEAKNGHDVVTRLTSEVPKLVFQQLKQE